MKFLIAFIAMFASASVLAKPSIKQINGNDQQIAVRATKNTTIGSQWIATTKSGSQCQFEVTQQSSSTAVVKCLIFVLDNDLRKVFSLLTIQPKQNPSLCG